MSREIRRVPKNWEHPKKVNKYNDKEVFKPLMDNYMGGLASYKEEVDEFISHMTEIIQTGSTKLYSKVHTDTRELYEYFTDGSQMMNLPDINDYMPSGEWFQLFENVSEGTPLSPPFETKEELIEWLVNNVDYWDHQWTIGQATAILEIGWSLSGVMVNGKYYTSPEAVELQQVGGLK